MMLPGGWTRLDVRESLFAGYRRAAVLGDGSVLVTSPRATDVFRGNQRIDAGPMMQPRALPAVLALEDGSVLAAGGYFESKDAPPTASVERFDPGDLTWSSAPPLRQRRVGAAMVRMGRRAVVIGGQTDGVESWAPGEPAWTALPSLPAASGCGAPRAVVLGDGSVLVVDGGAWILDREARAWRATPRGPRRTDVALVARADGGAMAIGGHDGERDVASVDVLGSDGVWRQGPLLPDSRRRAAAIELASGAVFVVGGEGTRHRTPDVGDSLYGWESEFRRVSTEWEDRRTDLTDALTLAADAAGARGEWTSHFAMAVTAPELVRLDGARVVLTGLSATFVCAVEG